MTDSASAENGWKPSPPLAFLFGIALQPLAYLYVNRGVYCLSYLFLWSILVIASFSLQSHPIFGPFINTQIVIYSLAVIAASHAFHLAKNYTDEQRKWYANWWKVVSIALLYVVSIFSFRAFVFEPFTVPSDSMSPNLERGDILIVEKQGYGTYQAYNVNLFRSDMSQSPIRGEILVFRYPPEPEQAYVKRLVGLPGDKIEYKNKILTVTPSCHYSDVSCFSNATSSREFVSAMADTESFVLFNETIGKASYQIKLDQLRSELLSRYFVQEGMEIGEWKVPEGHYFMLGDNRGDSMDSRYFGFVTHENIIGKVIRKM